MVQRKTSHPLFAFPQTFGGASQHACSFSFADQSPLFSGFNGIFVGSLHFWGAQNADCVINQRTNFCFFRPDLTSQGLTLRCTIQRGGCMIWRGVSLHKWGWDCNSSARLNERLLMHKNLQNPRQIRFCPGSFCRYERIALCIVASIKSKRCHPKREVIT